MALSDASQRRSLRGGVARSKAVAHTAMGVRQFIVVTRKRLTSLDLNREDLKRTKKTR